MNYEQGMGLVTIYIMRNLMGATISMANNKWQCATFSIERVNAVGLLLLTLSNPSPRK